VEERVEVLGSREGWVIVGLCVGLVGVDVASGGLSDAWEEVDGVELGGVVSVVVVVMVASSSVCSIIVGGFVMLVSVK
jgi:hypothetical protein